MSPFRSLLLELPQLLLRREARMEQSSIQKTGSYLSKVEKRRRLMKLLRMHGVKEKPVRGDGCCQFRALADQLYGSEEHHAFVRQQVVKPNKRSLRCTQRLSQPITGSKRAWAMRE